MDANPLPEAKVQAGMDFAMDAIKRIPTDDKEAMEAHITGVLIVFWGALWGTLGTEYARGYIEAQLRGMEPERSHTVFTKPRIQ